MLHWVCYIGNQNRSSDARVQSEELSKRCRDEAATSSSEDEQPPPKLARQQAVSDPVVDAPAEVEPEPAASAPVEVDKPTAGQGCHKAADISLLFCTCGVCTTQMCTSYTKCTVRLCQLHSQTLKPSFLRPPHTH
eukprot:COSAG06_NODE_942_length_11372_cov_34.771120_4_plen_135_part_00